MAVWIKKLRQKRQGLSLLEIVISISIFSVIMLAAYSVLFTGLKIYNMETRAIEDQRAMRMVFMRIDQDMRSYDGQMSEVVAGSGSLTIGTRAVYTLDTTSDSIIRTAGGSSSVITGNVLAFETQIGADNDSILVQLTGKNNNHTIQSQIKMRNSVS